jgi:hypothetical protein
MKKIISSIVLVCSIVCSISAQLTTFNYPTAAGQAFLSDKYDVYVKVGTGAEQKLQVLMSDVNYRTMYDGDWMKAENKDRTFSFVHLDYDKAAAGLTFRVVKKFGNNSASAVISPKSYGYTPNLTSGKELTFKMNDNQKYISINFVGSDNQSPSKAWIKNMLCIFVDPPETNKPSKTGAGVVVYSKTASATALANATTIYFPAGYHNLREYTNEGLINSDGQITIKSGQSLYLEGGAFFEGVVKRTAYNDVNQKIYGRGIITGRQYYWRNHPSFTGNIDYGQLLEVGNNAEVSGIMYMESPNHGLVGRNVHVKNVKFLGWHSNHDGVRVGEGSEIENSFLRAVDDHFYNFDIWVHDCVLWAGHNGSIMCYGWGGEAGSNNYGCGSSIMENIDIINPEWTALGNNNGLIMSQQGYNHPIKDYGTGSATTILRNIRIEGSIPGLTNLKPRSNGSGNIAVQVATNDVTFLGDLILENITVENQYSKGLIRGEADPDYNGSKKWLVKDVQFKNVSIGGICVDESNKNQFFNIDANTIQNVTFNCTAAAILPVNSFENVVANQELKGTMQIKTLAYDGNYGTVHGAGIKQINYQIFDVSDLTTALDFFPITTSPFYWTLNTKNYSNGDYQIRAGAISLDAGETKWVVQNVKINNPITSTEDMNLASAITVYPNPVANKLYIQGENVGEWRLVNAIGNLVLTGENTEIELKELNSGLYVLELNGLKFKIIKE